MNDETFSLVCDFDQGLSFANIASERNRIININPDISKIEYPLTKNFLQTYYNTTDYSNAKNSFNKIDCFADVYSYLILSYGKATGTGKDLTKTGSGSSGILPFGIGNIGLSLPGWLTNIFGWILLLYVLSKLNSGDK